jgi:hypothetical protein
MTSSRCRYGITKIVEKRLLGYECKIPATRNVTCLDDYTPSGMAVIDLSELFLEES